MSECSMLCITTRLLHLNLGSEMGSVDQVNISKKKFYSLPCILGFQYREIDFDFKPIEKFYQTKVELYQPRYIVILSGKNILFITI